MKKLLIAGGSHSDIPLIIAAKHLGYYVITSGNRPSDFGHSYGDKYILCDYSNPDSLLTISKNNHIDVICPSCNDFSAISCSYVAKELGLPGYDDPNTSETIHHKDKWRNFAIANNIPSPKAYGCSNIEEAKSAISNLNFPLMIKPVDLTGGKGIMRTHNSTDSVQAVRNAFEVSKAKRIVIEEFITGTRHGFSCILRNGKVIFHFEDDEIYHISDYVVSATCSPSTCSESSIEQLIFYSERIASLLNLVDGVFHVQFIQDPKGTPVIIEICRRGPGDLYVDFVRYATEINYADLIVRSFAGLDLENIPHKRTSNYIVRHCLMAFKSGIFLDFNFEPSTNAKIIDKLFLAKKGEMVIDPTTHKFGIVFLKYSDIQHMHQEAPHLQKLLQICVESNI